MRRWLIGGTLLFLLFWPGTPALLGQYDPYLGRSHPAAPPGPGADNPRRQRAARNRAVARVGPVARDFVETYGEDAVAAIFRCSRSEGLNLALFHAAGDLGKLPRVRELLRAIGQPNHGDDVAAWIRAHVKELADADHMEAFLLDPLPYALALKSLEDGAAEARKRRLAREQFQAAEARRQQLAGEEFNGQQAEQGAQSFSGVRMFCLGVAGAVMVGLVVWRVRHLSGTGGLTL